MQFIAKIVAYRSNYGMAMGVRKTSDPILPDDFIFLFPHDIDKNRGMEMTFYKRGQPIETIGSEILYEMEGEIGIHLANITTFPKTQSTVNLMERCLRCDAILFKYTSTDGEYKSFRFPLTGFAEHYLEQFI